MAQPVVEHGGSWLNQLVISHSNEVLPDGETDIPLQLSSGISVLQGWVGTLLCCLMHLLVGPCLIILNNYIMKDLGFCYPFAVCGLGQLASFVCTVLVFRVFKLSKLEHPRLEPEDLQSMVVVGFTSAATLSFGNAAYMYLTVSLIQMLKAFTPCITMALLMVFRLAIPSKLVALMVILIGFGTAIATAGAPSISFFGLVLALGSAVCEGIKLVLTQKFLKELNLSAFEGLYYASPICTLWIMSFVCIFELKAMVTSGKYVLVWEHCHCFLLSGMLGLLTNVAMFLVIKRTGAVTLKVIATARNAALVLYGVGIVKEPASVQQLVGYSVSLLAFGGYNYCTLYGL